MSRYDVIIIGAGPAGSTSALLLARQGFKVIALEKAKFPRFHIGESILPQNFPLIQDLGLEEALFRLPHLKKYGAEFGMGDDHNTTRFNFDSALIPGSNTFNVERAYFDKMLMDEARAAGAEIREETGVRSIETLTHGECSVIDRQKRWSVLLSVRCPPTAFPAAIRLEDGNVGMARLEKQL